jgi:hypothetical protein
MNDATTLLEQLRNAFIPSSRGVIGLVDDLFAIGKEQPLQLRWEGNGCQISVGSNTQQVTVTKSVFRAAIARIAAICNEQIPNSVTPYVGEAEAVVGVQSPRTYHIAFRNVPDELCLALMPTVSTTIGNNVPNALGTDQFKAAVS